MDKLRLILASAIYLFSVYVSYFEKYVLGEISLFLIGFYVLGLMLFQLVFEFKRELGELSRLNYHLLTLEIAVIELGLLVLAVFNVTIDIDFKFWLVMFLVFLNFLVSERLVNWSL